MASHMKYMWMCAAVVALAAVLVLVGGGGLAILAPLGCAAMMGMMVWMMVRGHGH